MTQKGKALLTLVVTVIVGLAIYGAYQYPVASQQSTGSTSGSSFGTQKYAGVVIGLASPGANGTSTSILNGDSSDRYVTAIKIGCETLGTSKTAYSGTGLAALTFSVATSSTSAPATNSNTNIVGTTALTVGTSTGNFVFASSTASNGSTAPGSVLVSNIWLANSYMTFTANATNTAACTVGVEYTAS